MKFVTTVGTTGFDSLIRKIDALASKFSEHVFLSQIGPGIFQPINHPYIVYEDDFFARHPDAVLITHCGAGTVYDLLETKRRFIAVPNLERADPHQIELAQFLQRNSYAPVCFEVDDLSEVFETRAWETFLFSAYEKKPFFRADELRRKMDDWLG
jgi:beta-1,4-N-acetylglucosaminyltransferase